MALVLSSLSVVSLLLVPVGRCLAEAPPSAVGALLRLYQSDRLPAERQPAVVEMICARGNEHDLRVVLDRLLRPDGMAPSLRLQALGWLTEAAETRKVAPAGDVSGLIELTRSKDAGTRSAAVRLAAALRVEGVLPMLVAIASDPQTPAARQADAIRGLAAFGARSRDTLQQLAAAGPSTAVRMQAIGALAGVDLPAAVDAAGRLLSSATPQDDPAVMLDAIFERQRGAELLARALRETNLSADVAKRALRHMYSVGRSDAALSELLSRAAGVAVDPPPPTQDEVAQLVREVLAKGDPARGEQIFRRADLSCIRCHSLQRAGGQVGPELSAVGGSSPVDYIVNSILNPNLAVKEQYVTRVFQTSDGRALTGIVIDRDESRVRLRDAQGKMHVLPTADIEEEFEGQTMMPQGLTKFLTRDELLDLVRFVSELGKPGPYGIRTAAIVQRWQVLAQPASELVDSPPHLEHFRQLIAGAPPEAWVSVFARFSGHLPLRELLPAGDPGVVIVRGELQVTEPGRVIARIESTEPFQVWFDASPHESRSEFETEVDAGRHPITLRVEVSARDDPELRVEFVRPEGSAARFEVVGGS